MNSEYINSQLEELEKRHDRALRNYAYSKITVWAISIGSMLYGGYYQSKIEPEKPAIIETHESAKKTLSSLKLQKDSSQYPYIPNGLDKDLESVFNTQSKQSLEKAIVKVEEDIREIEKNQLFVGYHDQLAQAKNVGLYYVLGAYGFLFVGAICTVVSRKKETSRYNKERQSLLLKRST